MIESTRITKIIRLLCSAALLCTSATTSFAQSHIFDFDDLPFLWQAPEAFPAVGFSGGTEVTTLNARSAPHSIILFGSDISETASYGYYTAYQTNIPVTTATMLEYYVKPLFGSTSFAVDLRFSDGTYLRDSGAVDQFGVPIHPTDQGNGGQLSLEYNRIESNIGAWVAGKTITEIIVGFDCPESTGWVNAAFDDILIYELYSISDPFGLARFHPDEFLDPDIKGDLMFTTKYTALDGTPYSITIFGDTFYAGNLNGHAIGWSTDFDLSDGIDFTYKRNEYGWNAPAMTPLGLTVPPPDPSEPDANESQIWFSRSFVLGQDIYSYYASFGPGHTILGKGLAVIRGGIADFNNMPEFERVSKETFWHEPVLWQGQPVVFWLDGHPVIKPVSDGYLYLFNAFGVQRVLATPAAVEDMDAYEKWTAVGWVPNATPWQPALAMWDQDTDFALRATCEWNEYLQKWISIYSVTDSEDGQRSQLAYRTADEITGPWSERTVFYYGSSKSKGVGEGPGDSYSPVHRSFFDKDEGRTIFTFFSQAGSTGPIPMLEYSFDQQAATTKQARIDDFAPQGLDETVNFHKEGTSTFYFRETQQGSTVYPNSSLHTTTDFDAADGITFDDALKLKPLPLASGESKVWLTAPLRTVDDVGSFFKSFDAAGQSLGTGYAYTTVNNFHRSFKRDGGMLSPDALVSSINQIVVDPALLKHVIINNEEDLNGNVYLARIDTAGLSHPRDFGDVLTVETNYEYSTVADGGNGFMTRQWTAFPENAEPIFDNALKPSVFKNPYTNTWIALYTAKDSSAGANSQLTMRTAIRLIGPWSDPIALISEQNSGSVPGRLHNAKHLMGFDKEDGNVMYVYATDYESPAGVDVYEVRLR